MVDGHFILHPLKILRAPNWRFKEENNTATFVRHIKTDINWLAVFLSNSMTLCGVDDSLKDATWSTWFCVLWTNTSRWLLLSCEIQQSSNKLCWLYSILIIKHILVWCTPSSTPFLKISIFLTANQPHPFGRSKYPWDASRYSRCWPTACWRKITFLPVFWKDFTLSIRENMRKQRNDAVLDAKDWKSSRQKW